MVETRPFRPVEYDTTKVDFAAVVSPPFDVVDAATVKALRARSPYNVTHLTIPQGKGRGGAVRKGAKAVYDAVERRLADWLEAQVLVARDEECIYAYEARYTAEGKERRMRGVVLLVRIDPEYKHVVPHERVFEKPVAERLELLTATAWDLEPIELIYPGRSVEGSLWAYIDGSGRAPDLLATGLDGTQHLYWRITDTAVLGTVVAGLKGRKVYIADGHHRYATHVEYARRRRQSEYRPPRGAPYEFKMSVLVHAADPGLSILPTHRLVLKMGRRKPAAALAALEEHFVVEPLGGKGTVRARAEAALAGASGPTFVAYLGPRGGLWRLAARSAALSEALAPGRSSAWRSLDVSLLQRLVIQEGFAVAEKRWGDDVRYTQDWEAAVEAVDAKEAAAAVFHRPVTAQQLRAVADGGEVMPAKSTYFVPKLLSGVCFHRIGKQRFGKEHRRPTS